MLHGPGGNKVARWFSFLYWPSPVLLTVLLSIFFSRTEIKSCAGCSDCNVRFLTWINRIRTICGLVKLKHKQFQGNAEILRLIRCCVEMDPFVSLDSDLSVTPFLSGLHSQSLPINMTHNNNPQLSADARHSSQVSQPQA